MNANGARNLVTPLMAALWLVIAASVAGQVAGASRNESAYSIFAAAAFAGALLRVAWQINQPWWDGGAHDIGPAASSAQPMLAQRNAGLLAAGYGWGAASLLAVYLLSPLKWQHGWQYGCGMALIALLIFWVTRDLGARWSPRVERWLVLGTMIHSWAASAGVIWLIGMGKILSVKGDWAANVVFVAGAICIAGLSVLALRTARSLSAQAQAQS